MTKGSSAQEESLCRTSTLYPLLYRRTLRDSFYAHHIELDTPKASDSLIYTEGVVICKTDEDLPKRMPKEDWITVDVITMAAHKEVDILVLGAFGCGAFQNDPEVVARAYRTALDES